MQGPSKYNLESPRQYWFLRAISCRQYFFFFLLLHTVLWTLAPTLLRPSLPHDSLESLAWGMQWQWGYAKHPFLAAWLSAAVTHLGGTVGWPIYLLAQVSVSLTFLAVWWLALDFFPPKAALIATLSLEGILFYNVNSINFTPDTLQSPLWALLGLCLYRALESRLLRYWFVVGICAGLAMVTKYQAGLLFLSILCFLIFSAEARAKTTMRGLAIAVFTAWLITFPHLHWLIHHDFISIRYAVETPGQYAAKDPYSGHLWHSLQFLLANFGYVLGVFVLFWPFYRRPSATHDLTLCNIVVARQVVPKQSSDLKAAGLLRPQAASQRQALHQVSYDLNLFQWHFLVALGLGPLCLSFSYCMISGGFFPARWSTPYFCWLGMLMVGWLKPQVTKRQAWQFGVTLLLLSLLFLFSRFSGLYARHAQDAFLPNQQIAKQLSQLWHARYKTSVPYLAGSPYLVTAVASYMPDKPVPYLGFSVIESPWIDEIKLQQAGAMVILDVGGNYVWDHFSAQQTLALSPEIIARFPRLEWIGSYHFVRRDRAHEKILVKVGIIRPLQKPY